MRTRGILELCIDLWGNRHLLFDGKVVPVKNGRFEPVYPLAISWGNRSDHTGLLAYLILFAVTEDHDLSFRLHREYKLSVLLPIDSRGGAIITVQQVLDWIDYVDEDKWKNRSQRGHPAKKKSPRIASEARKPSRSILETTRNDSKRKGR